MPLDCPILGDVRSPHAQVSVGANLSAGGGLQGRFSTLPLKEPQRRGGGGRGGWPSSREPCGRGEEGALKPGSSHPSPAIQREVGRCSRPPSPRAPPPPLAQSCGLVQHSRGRGQRGLEGLTSASDQKTQQQDRKQRRVWEGLMGPVQGVVRHRGGTSLSKVWKTRPQGPELMPF